MTNSRHVVAAANRYGPHSFIGVRHFCPLMAFNMASYLIDKLRIEFGEEQGFVDQRGVFMTREEAHDVALLNNQIKYRVGGDEHSLFSENLY